VREQDKLARFSLEPLRRHLAVDRSLVDAELVEQTEERRPRRAGTATAEAPGVDLQHCREIGP
jgi:hypothetical protein